MHGEMSIDLSPFAALKGYGQCVDLVREIDSAVHANNDLLNKQHLLAHLAEVDPTASNVLDVWCEEIEARAAVI